MLYIIEGECMEDIGKVSIIIPTYNRAKLITKSVKSVLQQTYNNIEVIVIDDNSTDNTEQVLKKIKDKRLRYIKLKQNMGAAYARNIGIKKAKGKYIGFNDSDDIFHKTKVEKQLLNMISNNSDFDFCKLNKFCDSGIWELPNDEQDKAILKGSFISELVKNNYISTQAIIAKKEVFFDINFDEMLPRFQDYDLVLRIASKYSISYTNKPLVTVYVQNDSISNDNSRLKLACIVMLKKDYNLSESNQKILNDTLYKWLTYDINQRYDELNKEHFEMINNYSSLQSEYDKIINSKRWNLINKLFKYFDK
jgi:glycosyltransferase involved in cell wall biosynthesis